MAERFDFARSSAYWRHLPSGKGKADTAALASLDDRRLCEIWDTAFRERIRNYPEEEQFLRTFAEQCRGRSMLSVGSGLGFHELYYAAAGARVICADIVESNVAIVERVARVKGLRSLSARYVPHGDVNGLVEAADIVFLYGCLMHMPEAEQRALLASSRQSLRDGGRIVLMIYRWEFVRRLCGWTSVDQFDPVQFARRSDPAVGADVCPWADWHDDEKLERLAPGMTIAKKQSWNDGQYAWYELTERTARTTSPFFSAASLTRGRDIARVRQREFAPAAASLKRSWRGLSVETGATGSAYAAVAPANYAGRGANSVRASIQLIEGACSLGLLDDEYGVFVASSVATSPGRHDLLLLAPQWPRRARIVFSNHQSEMPRPTRFIVHDVRVLKRPIAEPPSHVV